MVRTKEPVNFLKYYLTLLNVQEKLVSIRNSRHNIWIFIKVLFPYEYS